MARLAFHGTEAAEPASRRLAAALDYLSRLRGEMTLSRGRPSRRDRSAAPRQGQICSGRQAAKSCRRGERKSPGLVCAAPNGHEVRYVRTDLGSSGRHVSPRRRVQPAVPHRLCLGVLIEARAIDPRLPSNRLLPARGLCIASPFRQRVHNLPWDSSSNASVTAIGSTSMWKWSPANWAYDQPRLCASVAGPS